MFSPEWSVLLLGKKRMKTATGQKIKKKKHVSIEYAQVVKRAKKAQ